MRTTILATRRLRGTGMRWGKMREEHKAAHTAARGQRDVRVPGEGVWLTINYA